MHRTLKELLISAVKKIAPEYYMRRTIERLKKNTNEVELKLLPYLCDCKMISLDIGASMGLYSFHMTELSASVKAFEARPQQAANLSAMFALATQNASVESVGLSNKNGEAIIRVLSKDPGRSTIENENTLRNKEGSDEVKINIEIKKLDEYKLENVGCIKIDVEGHEMAVLEGAEETISGSLPSLIIEIEERHKTNAVQDVTAFLEKRGYSGFFIINNNLFTLKDFSISEHQNVDNVGNWTNNYEKKGVYVNNFVFVPPHKQQDFVDSANKLLLN